MATTYREIRKLLEKQSCNRRKVNPLIKKMQWKERTKRKKLIYTLLSIVAPDRWHVYIRQKEVSVAAKIVKRKIQFMLLPFRFNNKSVLAKELITLWEQGITREQKKLTTKNNMRWVQEGYTRVQLAKAGDNQSHRTKMPGRKLTIPCKELRIGTPYIIKQPKNRWKTKPFLKRTPAYPQLSPK